MVWLCFETKKKRKPNTNRNKMQTQVNQSGNAVMSLSNIPLRNDARDNNMLYNIKTWQYRGNCILEYDKQQHYHERDYDKQATNISEKDMTYQGYLSHSGSKKIKRILEVWHEGIVENNKRAMICGTLKHRRLVFLTLTLSAVQVHSDIEIKRELLKPFMRILRENLGCKNYLWRAEKQQNHNIHFHIALDDYIDKKQVQALWNKCQEKKGYISRFHAKHGHFEAPSTQIEAVKNAEKLGQYFAKYIAKQKDELKVEGALWKCSKNLRNLIYFEVDVSSEEEAKLKEKMKKNEVSILVLEKCAIFTFRKYFKQQLMSEQAKSYYKLFLDSLIYCLYSKGEFISFVELYDYNIRKLTATHKLKKKMIEDRPIPIELVDGIQQNLFF